MAVLHSPESPYAQEARKWEMEYSAYGPPGRPRVYAEFPKRLYKAGRNQSGVPTIIEAITVDSAREEANYLSRGFREGQDRALEALHAYDLELATLAANRAYTDRQMSPAAQAEAAAADEATSAHLPVIPVKPVRKRVHRAKKVVPHAE